MLRYRHLRFPGGVFKAVTTSYDDGVRQDVRLAEILHRHGMKGTFNVNSNLFHLENRLSAKEIADKVLCYGHEVAVHGATHVAPGALRAAEGIREVMTDRLALEAAFDRLVRGMAYPDFGIRAMLNGASYEKIKGYLTDLDIAYARTLGEDNDRFELPTDWHAWMPTAHHNNPQVIAWAEKFQAMDLQKLQGKNQKPCLFYLWGHSYEFDTHDNWDRIETLCDILGGRDDCWYATNIEIYDYVQAYQSLIYSADSTRIYNPTNTMVWFTVDGRDYCIHPGESIKL